MCITCGETNNSFCQQPFSLFEVYYYNLSILTYGKMFNKFTSFFHGVYSYLP